MFTLIREINRTINLEKCFSELDDLYQKIKSGITLDSNPHKIREEIIKKYRDK